MWRCPQVILLLFSQTTFFLQDLTPFLAFYSIFLSGTFQNRCLFKSELQWRAICKCRSRSLETSPLTEIHSFERKLQYFWNTRNWIPEWIQRQLSLSNGFYSIPFNSGDQSIVLSTQATRYKEPKIISSEACINIWGGNECFTQLLSQLTTQRIPLQGYQRCHTFSQSKTPSEISTLKAADLPDK